jgi:choice-of-anchor A domain-containing protein
VQKLLQKVTISLLVFAAFQGCNRTQMQSIEPTSQENETSSVPDEQEEVIPGPAPMPAPLPDPVVTIPPMPEILDPEGNACLTSLPLFLALPNSNVAVSGDAYVDGDLHLAKNSTLGVTGNAVIAGTLLHDPTSTYSLHDADSVGRIASGSVDQEVSDIVSVSNYFAAAKATISYPDLVLKNDLEISLPSGKSIISVAGDLSASGGKILTLKGDSTSVVVLNISGQISVSGGSAVLLSGGLKAENVLINNTGTGRDISLTGGSPIAGTIIGVQRGISLSGGSLMYGAIFARGKVAVSGSSGFRMEKASFCPSK